MRTPIRYVALAVIVVVAVVAAVVTAQAQRGTPGGAGTPALSAQDYLDIQQLVSRYPYALDTGADNGNAYADLFAPDGEFVGSQGTTRGRDALAALGRLGFVEGRKPANGVAHFIMNHVIEPAPGGATGKEYMILVNIGENGKPGGEFSNVGGHYEDIYTKTPQGWRFKRRQFIASASRPAPQTAARPASITPLTAQDYLDIRALGARYAYGLDTGAESGNLYASVFTEDGEFHGPAAVPGGPPFDAKGRTELRTFALVDRGSAYVRHFVSNHLIEASAEGARGKVYLLVIDIAQPGKPTTVNMGGHYEDVYVRTPEGWRIKSRHFFRSKSAQTVQAEAAAAARAAKPAQ